MLHNIFVLGNEKWLASGWKSFHVPKIWRNCNFGSNKAQRGALMIQVVAALEPKCPVQSDGGQDGSSNIHLGVDSGKILSSSEDSEELSEKEKLRRMRISKANKGRTTWNKGKKHSPETRQRIKERTQLAMQNPKVRQKMANLKFAHVQSKETREKIGAAVRLRWKRRREMLRLQESCYLDWQNLIAEASRRGFVGQDELQWDSYEMLSQLEPELVERIERWKNMPRLKDRKAPKTPEQRRKISEAITAKWADPEYRERVYVALSKYHGSRVRVEGKPKKQPSDDRQARPSPPKKKAKARAKDNIKNVHFM